MGSKIWVIKTTLPESMNDEEVASFSHALIEAGAACIPVSYTHLPSPRD